MASRVIAEHRGIGYLLKDRVFNVEDFVAAAAPGRHRRLRDRPGRRWRADVGRPRRRAAARRSPRARARCSPLVAEGRTTTAAIAERMVDHPRNHVQKYVTSIFAKLGLPGTGDANHRRVLSVLTLLRG